MTKRHTVEEPQCADDLVQRRPRLSSSRCAKLGASVGWRGGQDNLRRYGWSADVRADFVVGQVHTMGLTVAAWKHLLVCRSSGFGCVRWMLDVKLDAAELPAHPRHPVYMIVWRARWRTALR